MKVKEGMQEAFDKFVEVNSTDGYSKTTADYTILWADLMESEIGDGDPNEIIPKIANRTSHEADVEGITGFMYGCAVNALSNLWEYGDILRSWHIKEYGYSGDGVVNPAILMVGA